MRIRPCVLMLFVFAAWGHSDAYAQSVKLRIEGSELQGGLPERISFVFTNSGNRNISIPPLSSCSRSYSGYLTLMLDFSPVRPQTSGRGGRCGGGSAHKPSILEQALAWKVVPPHSSFVVTLKRSELSYQEAAGVYV